MDRLNQIKGESGGSRDLTLDTSSPPSESFMTANESSSKYFSLSEVDSTFDVSPSKDSAISTRADSDQTLTDPELIQNISPIPKKVDSFQIGKQIEAANILSGGVNIFDDNDNSYDGDELVIDDNVPVEESSKTDEEHTFEKNVDSMANTANVAEAIPSIDTEVVLQIDGKNVNAIAIGNGLYLYRKGVEELAAIQMIDDNQQQPSFKFLKVRDNAEGNLEVYEEIEVEVPNKVPAKEGKVADKKTNVPVKDTCSQVKNAANDKIIDNKSQKVDSSVSKSMCNIDTDVQSESKSEVNLNGKKVKLNESRKSPLISTFTPMTYHSTPNKEGIPLTKTMVDQQLHPNRQIDNIKKTIEVHTDSSKRESPVRDKDCEPIKPREAPIPSFNKTELQSEKLNSVNDNEEKEDVSKTENFVPNEIEEIKNNKEDKEKMLQNVENLQRSIEDECKKVSNNDLEVNNQNKILTMSETLPVNNSISNETQLKCVNDHTAKDDKELILINDCKSNLITEVIKPNIEDKILSTKVEESNDSNPKHEIKDKQEPVKCTLENKESSHENKQKIEDAMPAAKLDEVTEKIQEKNEISMNENEVKSDKKTEDEQLIKSDKNNDIENNSSMIINSETMLQSAENLMNKSIESISVIKNQITTDCKIPIVDQIIKTEDLNRKISATKNDTSTVHNESSKKELPITDEKPSEVTSIGSTIHHSDPCTTDCKVDDTDTKKKQIKETSDFVTDTNRQSNKLDTTNKTEASKEMQNAIKRVPLDTEITIGECKDQNAAEKPRVSNIGENITRSLVVGKESSISSKHVLQSQMKTKQVTNFTKVKPVGTKPNNCSAVPFGKWTEANRQEFLNKIKETKIPGSISNTKQLKQPNDLNRRDVLQKIDTQRQVRTAKNQESSAHAKANVRVDSTAAFVNKPIPPIKSNDEQKKSINENESDKNKSLPGTVSFEEKYIEKNESLNTTNLNKIPTRRKEINNQDLIDKTIEGIISRAVSTKPHDEWKQTIKMDAAETLKHHNSIVSLDDIEKKMNELHGIPFVERPAHELPQVHTENKCEIPKDMKSKTQQLVSFRNNKDSVTENISDEEILEHQPVTGDMTGHKPKICKPSQEKLPTDETSANEDSKKDTIITEREFDKFARRNSITYENCLTVKFDGKESHNVIQTLVEKEAPSKKMNRNEMMLAESKAKSTNKHLMMRHNINSPKSALLNKTTSEEDSYNKNYQSQSKVQLAYQSALTAKRQLECPITTLEDKPVKVVFVESGSEFASTTLNVQGQELSPSKKLVQDFDSQSASESLDSDVVDSPCETKLQDEAKSKSKHQRKQVLTPVDIPELELIEPSELAINESPKKRRKVEETKEKTKTIPPKKSYLLNRVPANDKTTAIIPEIRSSDGGSDSKPYVIHSDAISAIDNLVKAAELIETQSEKTANAIDVPESDALSINTPVKRGRGRPRKYPVSDTSQQISKTPSPKKTRLTDSNISKKVIDSDDSDSNDAFIKENWTMGKINENIVCPICNKLFRSENVVFKHVKHCTGPSPNRSDSSRSLRKFSQSEGKSDESDSNISDSEDDKPIKPKVQVTKTAHSKKEDIIVIDDTPQKKVSEDVKMKENNKPVTILPKNDNLVCEFCGKTFRQLSYLVNHKQQHKKEEKKIENNEIHENKSIFCCEVCKKEFRKLHHLVQHRIIHNPNTTSKLSRKNSNDKNETISVTNIKRNKQDEDQSAGFRCEPCDKSFRKLHHLVEHRETHDGINKKVSSNNASSSNEGVKTTTNHMCAFCKKSFKKLHQLTEHEQRCDLCSEKSDDVKSVKSSLSTKDIIHECSLCYMVFPNEHSLNKHTIICLKKKKQSAAKQAKLLQQKENNENGEDVLGDEDKFSESDIQNQSDKDSETEKNKDVNLIKPIEKIETSTPVVEVSDDKIVSECKTETDMDYNVPEKVDIACLKRSIKDEEKFDKSDENSGKKQGKIRKIEVITIPDTPTPKKKIPSLKEKRVSIETKKPKLTTVTLPKANNEKTSTDVSDDDEVRYMLNPNIKKDVQEEKVFMKVRANKRSSLQFERPNSKDLVKRRISLQNPPKVQRSKSKVTGNKLIKPKSDKGPDVQVKTEQTDSDDSDVKYSFPETSLHSNDKDTLKTTKKEVIVSKRKSITGIARKKSIAIKHKIPVPSQTIKRRTTEVEHRCDCGQLFSSAALLSRHTTLAHTPPRVRRPRDPPPDKPPSKGPAAQAPQPKAGVQKKSVASSNVATAKTRKSVVDNKTSGKVVKSESNSKTLRSAAHKGVPVPDKMKRFMDKYK